MPEFKKQRFGNDRRPFAKGGFPGRPASRDREPSELYDAECNRCHERCQVPFRPNGKKPVYCKNCFNQGSDSKPSGYGNARRDHSVPQLQTDPRIDDIKKELARVNATLERLVVAVETATRTAELKATVRRLAPAAKPANAPAKKAAKKTIKTVKKAARK